MVLQGSDTGAGVLGNTRPFLHFGIVSFWTALAHITFLGNTGVPKMFQYLPILGHSSIWDLKYTPPQEELMT